MRGLRNHARRDGRSKRVKRGQFKPIIHCSICKQDKPRSEFYDRPGKPGCVNSTCKECSISRGKKYSRQISSKPEAERPVVLEKYCWRCKIVKPVSDFSKNRCVLDGHSRTCKACVLAIESSPIAIARKKDYRAQHKDRERISARLRLQRVKDDPALLSKYRHRMRMAQHKRRRRTDNAMDNGAPVSAAQFSAICAMATGKCLCCGRVSELTIDHVLPISKGGSNAPSNVQPLCRPCNSSKGVRVVDYRPWTMDIDGIELEVVSYAA